MRIKSQKNFFSGLMFTAVGAAFAWGATSYKVGTGARMGPGYFPLMLGLLLVVLGLAVAVSALAKGAPNGDPVGRWAWKPLGFVLGANVAFGILLGGLPSIGLPAMGMVVAVYALTVIASLASDEFKLKSVLILATCLNVGSYLAFVVLLKLQFRVWPSFIAG